jgi:hypothetical protein
MEFLGEQEGDVENKQMISFTITIIYNTMRAGNKK